MDAPAATHDWAAMEKFVSAVIQVECGNYVYDDAVWAAVKANLAARFTS
jgi:hypothetical protein